MLAKLAIVEVLHEAECKSKVCLDEYDHEGKPVSMGKVSDTWLPRFSRVLANGANAFSSRQILDNVSFIIFNYDRCMEHYLMRELGFYWNRSRAEELLP